MNRETESRKNRFTDEQNAVYSAIDSYIRNVWLDSGIWEPELEEVLDVVHEEWLDESSNVLDELEEQYEFDKKFEGMIGYM